MITAKYLLETSIKDTKTIIEIMKSGYEALAGKIVLASTEAGENAEEIAKKIADLKGVYKRYIDEEEASLRSNEARLTEVQKCE